MNPDQYSMVTDIKTVMWKESKNWLRIQGSRTRTIMTLISPFFLAIYLPIASETDWTETYWPLLMAFMVPTMIAGLMVPESFAGEKERNTLPTLLASRLPDRAILYGKMIFGILTGFLVGLLMLVVGLIVVNIAHGDGNFLFYKLNVLVAYLAISLLMATLTTGAGVLISMRSKTAQEASQILISALLMPPIFLGFGATMLLRSSGDWMQNLDVDLIIAGLAVVLLVAAVALVLAAMRRFQRNKLVFG